MRVKPKRPPRAYPRPLVKQAPAQIKQYKTQSDSHKGSTKQAPAGRERELAGLPKRGENPFTRPLGWPDCVGFLHISTLSSLRARTSESDQGVCFQKHTPWSDPETVRVPQPGPATCQNLLRSRIRERLQAIKVRAPVEMFSQISAKESAWSRCGHAEGLFSACVDALTISTMRQPLN